MFFAETQHETHYKELEAVTQYRQVCCRFTLGPWRDAEQTIKHSLIPKFDSIFAMLKVTMSLMKKRENKLLDYERVSSALQRGDVKCY